MKRLKYLVLILTITVLLTGCNLNTKATVTLMLDEEVYESYEGLSFSSSLELPIPEKEGYVFTGWTDGEDYYYDNFDIYKQPESILTATFELVDEMFVYEEIIEDGFHFINILEFNSDASIVRIPQTINDALVLNIVTGAFYDTNLIELYLPVDVYIHGNGVINNSQLQAVYYYGTSMVPTVKERYIPLTNYNEIIDEYNCEVIETISPDNFTLNTECPIKEVLEIDTINIAGVLYGNYRVMIDISIFENTMKYYIGDSAFNNNPVLHTYELNPMTNHIWVSSFRDCPELRNIIIDEENEYFTIEDGILYSKDKTTLIFYPSGKRDESFTFPDHVTSMNPSAFYQQTYLKEIYLPAHSISNLNFYKVYALEAINVHPDNEDYYSIDGVLFEENALLTYPISKPGTEYEVPDNIEEISRLAFYKNKHLTTIDLNEVKFISMDVFALSESLTTITFPESVEYISMSVLMLSNIDTVIFERSATVYETITVFPSTFLRGALENIQIIVPADSVDEYKDQFTEQADKDKVIPAN